MGHPNDYGSKIWLLPKAIKVILVKQLYKEYAERIFALSNIMITTEEPKILVQSLVMSVSKKNVSETKYSHEKVNWKDFQRLQKFNHKLLILHICSDLNTNSRFPYELYLI